MNFLRYGMLLYCIAILHISLGALPVHGIKKSCANLIADLFGEEKLSPKNALKIKKIIDAVGMQSYDIDIRSMNEFAFAHTGRDNALVFPGMNYLFIDEEFFEKLSDLEQRFMIGHELMHIYNHHGIKRLALLSSVIGSCLLFEDILLNDKIGKKIKHIMTHYLGQKSYLAGRILWPAMFVAIGILATYKLSRAQEIAADSQIVALLGREIIPAGIALLERYDDECGTLIPCSGFNTLLSSQPTFKERIINLKKLQFFNTDQ